MPNQPTIDNSAESLKRPRVRLARMSAIHTRSIEVLRFLSNTGRGIARLNHVIVYEEMVRRGVMDPHSTFERSEGARRPTDSAKALLNNASSLLCDLGLINVYGGGDRRYRNVWIITHDGLASLRHWDNVESDGLWPR